MKYLGINLIPQIKYLGFNLTKYVENLYEENYKTWINKIKEELNKWGDIPCSWMEKTISLRHQFFPI